MNYENTNRLSKDQDTFNLDIFFSLDNFFSQTNYKRVEKIKYYLIIFFKYIKKIIVKKRT